MEVPPDWEERTAEYRRQFDAAATALAAAIRTGVTDGAEIVSHLLARVEANLGGMGSITERRPGSWEANYVDQFLASTVGSDGEYLWEHRTEPLEIVVCVDDDMGDVDHARLYDDSTELVEQRMRAAAPATDDEYDEELEQQIDHMYDLIEQLRVAEYADYAARLEVAIREEAAKLDGLNAELVSVRVVEWNEVEMISAGEVVRPGVKLAKHLDWRSLEFLLWERARQRTPEPGPQPVGSQLPHLRIPELAQYT
jgi:hypothetical protein